MGIGLPMIGAVPAEADLTSFGDMTQKGNIHDVHMSESLTLKVFTSDDISLETGGSVWHAGFALAKYLMENPHLVQDMDVLEIGAGCGLVGITAAALGARSVTLTDIISQQSHLQKNIELNRLSWESSCSEVSFGILQFGDDKVTYSSQGLGGCASRCLSQNFDVILGADIGYDLSLHEPIARTLSALLLREVVTTQKDSESANRILKPGSSSRSIALLAEEIRWHDIHQWYLESLIEQQGECQNSDDDAECSPETAGIARNGIEYCEKVPGSRITYSRKLSHSSSFLREKTPELPVIGQISRDGSSSVENSDQNSKQPRKNPIHLLILTPEG